MVPKAVASPHCCRLRIPKRPFGPSPVDRVRNGKRRPTVTQPSTFARRCNAVFSRQQLRCQRVAGTAIFRR